jgi:hypothetical protein
MNQTGHGKEAMKVALTLFAALSVVGATPAASTSGKSGYLKYDDYGGSPYTVTYDNRSLIVGGDRGFFASIGIRQWSFFSSCITFAVFTAGFSVQCQLANHMPILSAACLVFQLS